MNEFTKDELKEIQSALSIFSGSPRGNSIFHKIKSMIDNYCDHDSSSGECEIFVDTCSKCNAFMLREKYYE